MTTINRLRRLALYEQVANALRNDILPTLQPGQRLLAESKLAAQLGVSVLTLRQALSALAQQGLIERRHGSGNYVTQPRLQSCVAVATELPENAHNTWFQTRMFQLLGAHFAERGYRVRHYAKPAGADWSDFIQDVQDGRLAGAAFIAMHPHSMGEALQRRGLPFIHTAEEFQHVVTPDAVGVIQTGAQYLLERGCRKIALMQWAEPDRPMTVACREAFAAVMAAHAVPIHAHWVQTLVNPSQPGAGWEQFREIWAARPEKPDGLLVTDDMILQDVALAILDLRIRVPDELQIVAQTNKGSGVHYPFPVVALEIDPHELVAGLGEMLIKLMNRESVAALPRYIAPRLILPPARPVPAPPAGEPITIAARHG